jgi:hypothetical protein
MASTNKTTHYDLSQYVGSDKPTYLGDYNTDMSKIDTAINSAQTKADSADLAATTAQTTAEGAQTTANTAVTNAATAQTAANTANNNIGTLANLTTTEKSTIVGAINEIDGDVGNLSALDTTNKNSLVSAVNEIKAEVDNGENYQSQEHKIGVWIDGSNIYRKCFSLSKSNFSSMGGQRYKADIPHGVTGLSKVLKASGSVKRNDGQYDMIPTGLTDSNNAISWGSYIGDISNTILPVIVGEGIYNGLQEVDIVFEYTKAE